MVVEGFKLIVPRNCSDLVRERMVHLNPEAAKWQLYELEERQEEIVAIEVFDRGNVSTRLVRCVDETEVERRFALNRTRAYAHARDGSRTLVLRGSRVPLS